MKKYLWQLYLWLLAMGIQPRRLFVFWRAWWYFWSNHRQLKKQLKNHPQFLIKSLYPILHERHETSGQMSGHYFHQDLLIARKIYQRNPSKHLDIGSRTDGFVAHVAVFRPIEVLDIRPQPSQVPNIITRQADLMQLPSDLMDYCDSVSSLHAIEHFGLGRYGDPIDAEGYLKAIKNITYILQQDGIFYFSVPIGEQRIEFNAHRVFSIAYVLSIFQKNYELLQFSFVDDEGKLQENINLTPELIENNCFCHFGCGIFEWKKIK